jgi:PAS domain S-box-containing protein
MPSIDFEQFVRAAGDAVVVADRDGNIVVWNAAATRLFGHGEAEALGQPLSLIIPERQRGRHDEGYAKTMRTGQTRYGTTLLKVPALHKDGHTLSIAFTVTMLTAPDGGVEAIAALIRDETARFNDDRAQRKRIAELEAALSAARATA